MNKLHLWHFYVSYLILNDFDGQRVHRVRIVRDWHGKMRRMFWSALPMFLLARDGWHWMGTYRAVDRCIWVCISPNGTAYAGMAKRVPRCTDTWPNRLRLHDSSSLLFALIAIERKNVRFLVHALNDNWKMFYFLLFYFLPCDFHVKTVNFVRQLFAVTDLCKFWIQNWLVCCSEWFTSVKTFVYPWMSQYQSSKTMLNYHGPVLPPIKDFDSKWNRVETWTWWKIFILMKINRAKRQYWNQIYFEITFSIKQWNFGSSLCLYGFGNFY